MRKNPFTTKKLKLFEKQQRGTGILEKYIPYHKVTRTDPSSSGRSGRYLANGRLQHFLSTNEYVVSLFATMHKDLYDVREQFPLKLANSQHELNDYSNCYGLLYPGTIEIASRLNIKHPVMRDDPSVLWKMTTDILITLLIDKKMQLIAVACKKKKPKGKRDIERLRIEKSYWEARNVQWLLITPDLYSKDYYNLLRAYKPRFDPQYIDETLLMRIKSDIQNKSCNYSELYKNLKSEGYRAEIIVNTFWIGFWFAELPIDVHIRFDPLRKLTLIDRDAFRSHNPIYSGRSSWI